MHASSWSLVALGGLLLGSCALETPTSPDPDGTAIVTDRSEYLLAAGQTGWEGEIDLEYTNRTERTISILNCNESFALKLEKREKGDWVQAWSPPIPMCLSRPIEIEPGATYSRTLRVFGGYPGGNTHPQFIVDEIDGTYRLVIESAYWEYDHGGPSWGEELPLEERASHAFEIRTP